MARNRESASHLGDAGSLVWLTYSELDASFFCRIAENGLYLFFTDVLHIDATTGKEQKTIIRKIAKNRHTP